MARAYHRRYYKRTKNSSSGGIVGIVIVVALVAYAYDINLDQALVYAVIAGLVVFAAISIFQLWKKSKIRVQAVLMSDIDNMTGLEFERYIASLLKKQGFTSIKLTEHYDLGVDIIARKEGVTWGVQVKRCSGMVKAAAVRQVVTALKKYRCERAMVVTNGIYSRPAIELARINDCLLVDRTRLIKLLEQKL